jgi:hypothetical protein
MKVFGCSSLKTGSFVDRSQLWSFTRLYCSLSVTSFARLTCSMKSELHSYSEPFVNVIGIHDLGSQMLQSILIEHAFMVTGPPVNFSVHSPL